MDDPKSEDSFVDDLLSALEQNNDQNNIRVLRNDPGRTTWTKRTEEERSKEEAWRDETNSQDLIQGAVTDISSSQDFHSSGKEVKEDESTSENLIPLNDDAVVVLGENVNISDLFESDIEFIYSYEPIGDIRNENEEDHVGTFEENAFVEVIVENNEAVGQIERENNSVQAVIQGEKDLEGDRTDKAMENNEAVGHIERENNSVQGEEDVEGDRTDEAIENNEAVGHIERENNSVQGEEDVEGDRTDEAIENNEEENIQINFEPNENNKDSKEKRKRNKKADPSSWEKNQTKIKRMTGQPFVGYQRNKTENNITVKRTDFEREGRKMSARCESEMCRKSAKRYCNIFSDNDRKSLFEQFWTLTWKEKEMYVKCNTSITEPKKRSGQAPSRRSGTISYNLKHNGVSKRVCKTMFLHTLGLNEWMVLNWINKNKKDGQEELADDSISLDVTDEASTSITDSTKKVSKLNLSKKRENLLEWFETIPKMPSHYARRDTKKLYLEPTWSSKSEMYRAYKQKMIEENKHWGSDALFDEVFNELNLSLFRPRKDQCDTCCSYKLGHIEHEVYTQHIKEKERAREEKEKDKELSLEKKIYCLTCDLQAVKITPLTKASCMYYKTKLTSHNFTVFDLATRDCTNYWFNETECELTANTFTSCLINYLEEKCLNPKLPIVIFSDGCTYQNRNQTMSNALLHFSITHNVQIEQKYLIKGHTQMECDSVHAQIERTLKGKDIYIPYEFVTYTKEARKEPFPYVAKYLSHDFFRDYTKISYYDSIRPGRLVGDSVVTDIHSLLYKDGRIQYKLQFDDPYKDLPRRPSVVDKNFKPPRLYHERLPIQESKWKHLQDLKSVIPSDFHSFYDNINYGKVPKLKNPQKQEESNSKNDPKMPRKRKTTFQSKQKQEESNSKNDPKMPRKRKTTFQSKPIKKPKN